MFSKNNFRELLRQNAPKKQQFTIKRLTIGTTSVLLGFSFWGVKAHADSTVAAGNSNDVATTAVTNQQSKVSVQSQAVPLTNTASADSSPTTGHSVNLSSSSTVSNSTTKNSTSTANSSVTASNNASTNDNSSKTAVDVSSLVHGSSRYINDEKIIQTYSVKITAVNDATGQPLVSNNVSYNFNFRNGIYYKELENGRDIYSLGTAPTGYKLMNPEILANNFTMDGNMAKVDGKDVDIILHYAPLSPVLIRYVDEGSGEVLSTTIVSADTSSSASLAYLAGDKTAVTPSRFRVSAIYIPGYRLDDEQYKVGTYTNVQSQGNPNYQIITFKYEKVMNNQNPKNSQTGSGAQYGEYFGPEWNVLDSRDSFEVSGVQGETYEAENGDIEARMNAVINKYQNQGYTYIGTFNYHQNTDYYNWNEEGIALNLVPNKPVTVKYVDERGNKLAGDETIAFNHDNPDQNNNGIDPNQYWYSKGQWHADSKVFDGYTLVTTYGATDGQFTPYAYVVTFEYARNAIAEVKYIDDDDNNILQDDNNLRDYVGHRIEYSTANSIAKYEGQGYELVSDNFTNSSQVYTNETNVYEVHLKRIKSPTRPHNDQPKPSATPAPPKAPNVTSTSVNKMTPEQSTGQSVTHRLPQTGNQQATLLSILGFGVLVSEIGFAFRKRKGL